jgi:hypothetical protein
VSFHQRLLAWSAVLVLGVPAFFIFPTGCFYFEVSRDLQEQGRLNDAAKPRVDAVMKDIHVGDTLGHAEQVLAEAHFGYTIDRSPSHPRLQSSFRAGPESGFSIELKLDRDDKVTKVDVHPYFTGP